MYSEIAANKRKTWFLVVIFTAVIVALGFFFGKEYGDPYGGIVLATAFATIMSLTGYFQGDSIALASAGARRIEKKDSEYVWNLVENLAIASGTPMPAVYLIEDPSGNAFATGRDPKHASIAITTGLVRMLSKAELEGVIAHEMSHVRNYDVRVMTIVVVLVGIVMLLSDWMLRGMFRRRGGNNGGEDGAMLFLVIGIVLAILSPIFAQLIKMAVSRQREYLADASGALLTRYPEGLASALQKIADADLPLKSANHATAHLFLANPFDPHVTKKFEQLFSTHPPILDRIKRLREMGV